MREEKIESRGQSILRKQQILCNLAEIETLKNIFPCLNTFKCTMSLQERMKRLKLTPLPMYKSPTSVQVSLDDQSLERFENTLYGLHAGAFCQIMEIFVSGYGKLDIDNDVLCVRLIFEEKIKF